MTLKTDITLISTPVMETRVPAPAIYYLKGSLNQHGYRSRCFDLVRDSEEHFGEQESKRVNSYLLADWHSGMHHDSNDNDIRDLVANYYRNYVRERILPLNSEWVGVSVFSQNSQKASDILCGAIREILPDTKIIIGGTGLGVQLGSNRARAGKISNGFATLAKSSSGSRKQRSITDPTCHAREIELFLYKAGYLLKGSLPTCFTCR